MTTIHLPLNHPACELVRIAFPDYSGRKIAVEISDGPFDFSSYWDSGNRDYHVLIRLVDRQVLPVPQNGTAYDRQSFASAPIAPGFAVVSRHFRGTNPQSVMITVHPSTVGSMALPAPEELTREERIVLSATRSFKPSYGGVSNYRFVEAQRITGIDSVSWSSAVQSLKSKKLLNNAGAITVEGKNAIGWVELYTFKPEAQCV